MEPIPIHNRSLRGVEDKNGGFSTTVYPSDVVDVVPADLYSALGTLTCEPEVGARCAGLKSAFYRSGIVE
jgi:hypothetical protein